MGNDAYRALTHRKGMVGTSIYCVKLKLQIITKELKLFVAVLPYPAVWRMFIFLINSNWVSARNMTHQKE